MISGKRLNYERSTNSLCSWFFYNDKNVVLIEKKRPEWQKGLLNGVGGHVEKGEASEQVMRREFKEETSLDVGNWKLGVILSGKTFIVYFFYADGEIEKVCTTTDEKIRIVEYTALPNKIIPNLKWLIPLCRDSDINKPVFLIDLCIAK